MSWQSDNSDAFKNTFEQACKALESSFEQLENSFKDCMTKAKADYQATENNQNPN